MATGTDQFGQAITVSAVTWSTDVGSCDANGTFHAPAVVAAGTVAHVHAVCGSLSADAQVTIRTVAADLTVAIQPGAGTYFTPLSATLSCADGTATCWYALAPEGVTLTDAGPTVGGSQSGTGPIALTASSTLVARAVRGNPTTGVYGPVSAAAYHVVDPNTLTLTVPTSRSQSPAIATLRGDLTGLTVDARDVLGTALAIQPSPGGTMDFAVPLVSDSNAITVTITDSGGRSVTHTGVVGRTTVDPSIADAPGTHLTSVPAAGLWFATPLSSGGGDTPPGTLSLGDGSPAIPVTPGVPLLVHYIKPGIYQLAYTGGGRTTTHTVWV
ncbi:MAG: hypothetical protein ACRDUB_23670, partial [Mycobacterium sp.]